MTRRNLTRAAVVLAATVALTSAGTAQAAYPKVCEGYQAGGYNGTASMLVMSAVQAYQGCASHGLRPAFRSASWIGWGSNHFEGWVAITGADNRADWCYVHWTFQTTNGIFYQGFNRKCSR